MSNDRDTTGVDALVTDAYKDLANEKAPESLNRSVLKMAGAEKRASKKPLFASWMKPVTWAATVGLSLAIVLEVSKLPTFDDADLDIPEASITESRSLTDEFENAAEEAKEQVDSRSRLAASPMRETQDDLSTETVSLEKSSPKRKQESFAAGASRVNSVARIAAPEQPSDEQSLEPQSADLEEIVVNEAAAADATMPAAAMALAQADFDIDSACHGKLRETADDWLQCIADLRLSGDEATADDEYRLFMRSFPEEAAIFEANR